METPAAKTPFRKKRFLILIGLFAGFRIITALLGLRFNSLYAEEIYWVLVSLVFVTWLIAAQRKPKVIAQLILAFSVFYCFVFVACVYFTWLFAGEAAPVKPERFNGMEQEVWIEYHRGILDEKVSEKLCIGKSYFHDWMHRKEDCLELSSPENSTPWAGVEAFRVPDSVEIRHCIFWQQKQLLFDMQTKTCYRLEPHEALASGNPH